MEEHIYKSMHYQQSRHWWYLARKEILQTLLDQYSCKSEDSKGLEVGGGTGVNTDILSNYTTLDVIEKNPFSVQLLKSKKKVNVLEGIFPQIFDKPYPKYNEIYMFDVLEHIENDEDALTCTHELLKDDGGLFITVPAYQFLYSNHDKDMHHYRRYSKKGIEEIIIRNGFEVIYSTYFNCFLFPLALISRVFVKLGVISYKKEQKVPKKRINTTLYKIFSSEKKTIPLFRFPFGLSVFVYARKK